METLFPLPTTGVPLESLADCPDRQMIANTPNCPLGHALYFHSQMYFFRPLEHALVIKECCVLPPAVSVKNQLATHC